MLLLLAAVMALVVAALAPLPAEAVIALRDVPPTINTVDGTVELSPDDGRSWTPAEPGMPVSAGAVLRTGDDGACVLDFSDESVVALLPQSTITMLPDDRKHRLQLSSGHIWVQLGSTGGDRSAVLAPYALVDAREPVTFTLDFEESGGTIRVMEGRVDLSTPGGSYESYAETGQALAATKSGNSMAYPFNVSAEQAAWEPLFAVTTTTSLPDETTETTETTTDDDTTVTTGGTTATLGGTTRTSPPADPEARDRFGRGGRVLIAGAAILFVLLLAAVIVLAVLLARRRRQPPAGMPRDYQPAKTVPPDYPPSAAAPYTGPAPKAPPAAAPEAPTSGGTAFCRHCGAQLPAEGRFCRVCGQEARFGGPKTGG